VKTNFFVILVVAVIVLLATSCSFNGQVSPVVPTQGTKPSTLSPALTETPATSPIKTQPISPTMIASATSTSSLPLVHLDAPLNLGLTEGMDYDFLEKHLRSTDYIAVHVKNIDALDRVSGTKRSLVLTSQDVNQISDIIALAKDKGIDMIGYNLEGQLTKAELTSGEIEVYDEVKAAGFPFIFGPTVSNLLRYYSDFAKNADAIMIQSQRMQGMDGYEENVKQLIANIKSVNPDIRVWVQVSVVPPNNPNAPVETVLNEIASIADSVDGLFLFVPPQRWETAKQIIASLRP
jgi:hypothetical protein